MAALNGPCRWKVLVKGLCERGCMGYLDVSEFELGGPRVNMMAAHFQDEAYFAGQHAVDTKAFTGKGISAQIRNAEAAMQEVVDDMERVRVMLLDYQVYGMILIFHHRKTGQVSLRWRNQFLHKHVTFTVVEEELQKHGSDVVEWYGKVNDAVNGFNKKYLVAANERKRLLVLKEQPKRATFNK